MNQLVRPIKRFAASRLPNSERLRYLAHRPLLEDWRRTSGDYPMFAARTELYDHISATILLDRPIQYLEFGVYKGETIACFAGLNKNPNSRFVGFDTFTGLPEDWVDFSRTVKRSAFDTGGETPKSADSRVSFVKGLFQDTLPAFLDTFVPNGQLVIHNDSDLYSSTLYVLTSASRIIAPGTIIIFDEFYSVMHEFRALEDYCSAYRRTYDVIGATRNHLQVAIRMK